MSVKKSKIKLHFKKLSISDKAKDTIIFLHGFTGSLNDWEKISSQFNGDYNIYAIDLIGHGKIDSPNEISKYLTSSQIDQLFRTISLITKDKIILAGYSMGGRLALSFSTVYPEMLKGLILESTAAGIVDEYLREERRKKDEELANFILNNPIEKFVDYWMNLDIFSTQKNLPEEILLKLKKDKLKNNKTGLANSLLGFSIGIMPPLFEKLKEINIKTLLITGELDKKYTNINNEMLKLFSAGKHAIIKNAGHNIHLEKPEIFYNVINNYLKEL